MEITPGTYIDSITCPLCNSKIKNIIEADDTYIYFLGICDCSLWEKTENKFGYNYIKKTPDEIDVCSNCNRLCMSEDLSGDTCNDCKAKQS